MGQSSRGGYFIRENYHKRGKGEGGDRPPGHIVNVHRWCVGPKMAWT